MRHGTRVLIGPLVGAVAIASVLTGCGSPGSDADPTVASPPTTAETASTSEVLQTTTTTPASEPNGTTTVAPTTIAPTTVVAGPTAATVAPTTIPRPSVAAAPTTSVPGMSAEELAALEAELGAIDAILTELDQNLAAD